MCGIADCAAFVNVHVCILAVMTFYNVIRWVVLLTVLLLCVGGVMHYDPMMIP